MSFVAALVSVGAYSSVVPKIATSFGLAQVVRDLHTHTGWPLAVAVLAVLLITYGNLAALVQENVIRLLAYSSIARSGYYLLAVIALGRGNLAIPLLVVFAVAYAAMNIGALAVVADFPGLGRFGPVMGGDDGLPDITRRDPTVSPAASVGSLLSCHFLRR